jgi:iron(III) transport system ATP-binding protein
VVKRSVFLGDLTQVHVDWGGRELVIRQTDLNMVPPGQAAYLSIDPACCILLEAG